MPWADLAWHSFALVVYPGALLVLGVGLLVQVAAGRLLAAPQLGWPPRPRAIAVAALAPPVPVAVLLAVLAATQMAIPFNPVSSVEQSVLVAVVALAAAAWVAWARSGPPPRPDRALLGHVCWLLAMLGPAVAAGTMQPAALAAIAVPIQLPVKVAAGALALLCLPVALQLVPEARLGTPALAGVARWLPCCGLFASVFLPPAADDVGGAARFGAETAAVAVVALIVAVLVSRSALASVYWPALVILAAITAALAALALIG